MAGLCPGHPRLALMPPKMRTSACLRLNKGMFLGDSGESSIGHEPSIWQLPVGLLQRSVQQPLFYSRWAH
jgi:hypothetical protein